jgi:excisionase family DNA binding protein
VVQSVQQPHAAKGGGAKRYETLLTPAEVRDVLRVSPRTLDNLIARGVLPVVRFGKARRFKRDDVVRCVERHRIENGTATEA